MSSRPSTAPRRSAAIIAAFGLIAGVGLVALPPAVEPAAAVIGECPEGTIPGPGNTNPIWTDQNVAIYAGDDFQVREGAAEAPRIIRLRPGETGPHILSGFFRRRS